MGFWNSFKGQLGRDIGRVISRKLYGTRHAILHERVNSVDVENLREKQKLELEKEKIDLERKR